jgi:hypothetical protein
VRGRVEALLTARAAAHLASLQVGNDRRKYFALESVRGREVALLTARAAAHFASLQVEMAQENILPWQFIFNFRGKLRSVYLFHEVPSATNFFPSRNEIVKITAK